MKKCSIKYVFFLSKSTFKKMRIFTLKNKKQNLEKIQTYKNFTNHLIKYFLMKSVHTLTIKTTKIWKLQLDI